MSSRRDFGSTFGIRLFDAAETIEKLLGRAERRVVQFLEAIQQAKAHAELGVQGIRVITNDLETAALRGSRWPERADEHVPARLDRAGNLANVGDTLIIGG